VNKLLIINQILKKQQQQADRSSSVDNTIRGSRNNKLDHDCLVIPKHYLYEDDERRGVGQCYEKNENRHIVGTYMSPTFTMMERRKQDENEDSLVEIALQQYLEKLRAKRKVSTLVKRFEQIAEVQNYY
jgi:hypothetical protein